MTPELTTAKVAGEPKPESTADRTERATMDATADGTADGTAETTARVRWIREHSGLTWHQLGLMFGVSRHAVHMWANGGRVIPTVADRLKALADIIEDFELDFIRCGMPDADLPEQMQDVVMRDLIRNRLAMQEDQNAIGGTSVIDRFRRESIPPGRTWAAPFSPEELVGARH